MKIIFLKVSMASPELQCSNDKLKNRDSECTAHLLLILCTLVSCSFYNTIVLTFDTYMLNFSFSLFQSVMLHVRLTLCNLRNASILCVEAVFHK